MKKNNYKFAALLIAAILSVSALTACSNTNSSDTNSIGSQSNTTLDTKDNPKKSENGDNSENTENTETSDSESDDKMFSKRDLSGEYDTENAVNLTWGDKGFTTNGEGAEYKNDILTITKEGVYILSGNVKDGKIVVKANEDAKVQLVFNGFSITSSDYAPINILSADKVFITLAENTENNVADSKKYNLISDDDETDAAIYSKCDLTINGKGILTVAGNMANAVKTKDDLKITGGTIEIEAAECAVFGKDSVRIADGNITLKSGGDGIKSTKDSKDGQGFIYVSGGNITVESDGDALQAAKNVTIDDSNITIKSGGGADESTKTHTDDMMQGGMGFKPDFSGMPDMSGMPSMPNGSDMPDMPDMPDMSGMKRGENRNNTNSNDTSTSKTENSSSADTSSQSVSTEDTSTSSKGIKAGTDIAINGGTITIDSADDSIHANGNVKITGGTIDAASGDDGIHADTSVEISGGSLMIRKSYEAIEGSNVTVSGGTVHVTSEDDGFNAGGGDGSSMGGRPGENTFTANSDSYLKFTGGDVYVNAGGDGIDSNNNIIIEGGEIYIDGPTEDFNSAIDFETSATISGGTVIAVGSASMAETFSEDSSQGSILYCLSKYQNPGDKVTLKDESGKEIISYTPSKIFSAVNISTSDIKKGSKYTLTIGSESYEIEMTSNSFANGGMSSGFGGMGGMGGKMPPQMNGTVQNSDK